ncbi:MAG: TldD/PmbA family protein [Clostridiales bacterium]|nr:TldD/PmbA family protein [Clostridiales bacterium]
MKTLLEKILKVCDHAEVYSRIMFSTSVSVQAGEMQGIESEKKTEVAIRIVKGDKMGAAVATNLDDESIIERALISLENQKSEAVEFPNESVENVICSSDQVKNMNTQELVRLTFDVSDRLKTFAPEITSGVEFVKTVKNVKMINSSGFEGEYDYTNIAAQIYTLNEQGFYSTIKEYSGSDLPEIKDDHLLNMIELHKLGNHMVTLENEKMPVVFSGNVMGSLMLRVLGGVNGGNVSKSISPVGDKLGQKLFSEKITIRDDATMSMGCNSYAFDDEGTPAQNTVIYENGVLKNFLVSSGQSKKLGRKPTGNAQKRTLFSKEIEDSPSVFDTNIIIEGHSIPDQEIIGGIKRGLFITGVMGAHTGNINQGDFSMNISSGFLIENGKMIGKVKGAMIAGNIYDLFKNVEAIGTEKEVMRSIFYTMGYSPMVLFSEANIVGR